MAKNIVLINPESGTIDRIFCNGNVRKNVGARNTKGYVQVRIDDALKVAHRVIWEHVNGPIASGLQVDHINGVRHDNRISNLRLVTPSQNSENQKTCHADNKSGKKGVCFDTLTRKWRASITKNGKVKYLGIFKTIEEADEVYCLAASMLHTHNPCAA